MKAGVVGVFGFGDAGEKMIGGGPRGVGVSGAESVDASIAPPSCIMMVDEAGRSIMVGSGSLANCACSFLGNDTAVRRSRCEHTNIVVVVWGEK
jgi:hypothetical protein